MQYQKDVGRGRRPREHASREDASGTAGGPSSESLRVPHPEKSWNGSEWRQWDKNHGHMLWMGNVQASGGTGIPGIFLCDLLITSTRKQSSTNCFALFGFAFHLYNQVSAQRVGLRAVAPALLALVFVKVGG